MKFIILLLTIGILFSDSCLNYVFATSNSDFEITNADTLWEMNLTKPEINVFSVIPTEIPIVMAETVWQNNLFKPEINVVSVTPAEIPIVIAETVWQKNLVKPEINVVTVTPAEIPIVTAETVWSTYLIRPGKYINIIESADLNNNGFTDLEDVIIALQVCAEINSPRNQSFEADVNGDSKIGIQEAICILKLLAKISVN